MASVMSIWCKLHDLDVGGRAEILQRKLSILVIKKKKKKGALGWNSIHRAFNSKDTFLRNWLPTRNS